MRILARTTRIGVLPFAVLFAAPGCGGNGDSGGSSACPTGQEDCGGQCVRLATNAAHCGACGTACGTTQICTGGECLCADAFTRCGEGCVDLVSDPEHCGDCDTVCGESDVCSEGACASDCAEGRTRCDRSCADLQSSATDCGECGNACASGQTCTGGECTCGSAGRLCGDSCVNISTDPSHCGACGQRCGEGEECHAGVCEEAAAPPPVITASCTEPFSEDQSCGATAVGRTYYVSTSGDDANDGQSEDSPIQTLARVEELALAPGDRVLFKCGDLWRGEALTIRSSGADCRHIVYGSYPSACEESPRISGSYPISGWSQGDDGVWSADLSAGENAGRFPNGINQVFRGEQRLPLGRWPNRDDPEFPGGYSRIVTHQNGTEVGDPRLAPGDWSGATFHHFSIRWLLLNTYVESSGEGTLSLATPIDCYDGCGDPDRQDPEEFGWGYYLSNHRATLDEQGEWYYEASTRRLHLVSGAEPAEIEGSVVPEGVERPEDPTNDEGYGGLVNLGGNRMEGLHHVVVENLRLENGWRDGIGTPINPTGVLSDVTIRCNTVRNPDNNGLQLGVWSLDVGAWRGGERIQVLNNVFDGPNRNGIRSLAVDSVFQDNLLANVGLLENLGPAGLGCHFGDANCTSNGDGIILERYDAGEACSNRVTVRGNRLQRTGQCGIDVLGRNVTVEENVIDEACSTKGDCGGVCALESPDLTIRRNIVRDPISPMDGFSSSYHEAFAFGIYLDASPADTTDNTVVNTQGYGILYQGDGMSGDVIGNTVYGGHGRVLLNSTFGGVIDHLRGNVLVGTEPIRLMFTEGGGRILESDENYFIQPYMDEYISMQVAEWVGMNLAEWQSFSGQDASSKAAWFTTPEGSEPRTSLFVNDTAEEQTVALDRAYLDLDQQAVLDSITLPPFSSRVLVAE